ncbi:hypothetical protein MAPG_02172 [Magnaporthiopsis poae ATCC 64411]|uniref:Uncharacterized protein n=1 Tax=Magnaporthiopsis poae (strain ATCC 64411 / 73-15) TaxID=644358 RepID=A0A0C4DQM9_MAGP6|nr:hypothetical protein MAPG_02172 [Magnaporthiopsis poae ATCC 64411]
MARTRPAVVTATRRRSKIPSPAKKLKLNGPKTALGAVAAVAKPPKAVGKEADAGSESSGTLSSPPRP